MRVTIVIGALGTIPKGLIRGLEELEIGKQAKTKQNTEKSSGHSRRLDITQTSEKNHPLMLM